MSATTTDVEVSAGALERCFVQNLSTFSKKEALRGSEWVKRGA